MERVTGIEPALSAWEADVLPLNYTRATGLPAAEKSISDPGARNHAGSACRAVRTGLTWNIRVCCAVSGSVSKFGAERIEKRGWTVCTGGSWAVFHKGRVQDWAGSSSSGRLERVAGGNIRRNVRMRSSPGPDKMVAGQLDEGVNGGNRHN